MKITFNALIIAVILFTNCTGGTSDQCADCDCENVIDCLSKYKFEEARTYDSKRDIQFGESQLPQIIETEVGYWISQQEPKQAYIILMQDISKLSSLKRNELIGQLITSKISKNDQENLVDLIKNLSYFEKWDSWQYDVIDDVTNSYIDCLRDVTVFLAKKKKNDLLTELELVVPEKILFERTQVDIVGSGEANPDAKCKKKYEEIKKGLQDNQVIESFHGCDFNYEIMTYKYPQKEIREIVKKFNS